MGFWQPKAIGTDHNGDYLADKETGAKTPDKDKAETLDIPDAVDAKRHGTIIDYQIINRPERAK